MLSARNIAALGFMTFAMYLGAGNLIFPPFLGSDHCWCTYTDSLDKAQCQ